MTPIHHPLPTPNIPAAVARDIFNDLQAVLVERRRVRGLVVEARGPAEALARILV